MCPINGNWRARSLNNNIVTCNTIRKTVEYNKTNLEIFDNIYMIVDKRIYMHEIRLVCPIAIVVQCKFFVMNLSKQIQYIECTLLY